MGIEPRPLITYDFKSNTILSGLTWHLLVRLRLSSSLYSHALLILTKSSKSKNQVVHEQKFKDLLSNESVGLGIRGHERPGFYPQWRVTYCYWTILTIVNIWSLGILFDVVKSLMSILALLPVSSSL